MIAETYREDVFETMFKFAQDAVFNDGGDGGGWIVCDNPLDMASKFEAWQQKNNDHWLDKRQDRDGLISFAHGQEYIVFLKDRSKAPYHPELGFVDTVLIEC